MTFTYAEQAPHTERARETGISVAPRRRTLVVDPNPDSRLDAVTAARGAELEVVGEAPYGAEATFLAVDRAPSLILLAIEEPPIRGLATLEALRRERPDTPVLVYSSNGEPQFLRRAMRAGARDFLAKPLRRADLAEAVQSVLAADDGGDDGPVTTEGRGGGTVITVAGAKGGIGKSTLAGNLAIALRQLAHQEVALLDADVQFGDIGVMFDLEPSPDACVSTLAREGVALTRQAVADCVLTHSSGINILGVAPGPEDWRMVRPEQIERIARALAETHEYVVVDTPGTINELVAASLCAADIVLLVTSLEMSSIKDTKTAVRVLDSLHIDPERVRLVINDSTGASHITPDDVAEATGVRVAQVVPHDRQLGRSVQRGVPVLLERADGRFSRAVTDLAGALAGVAPARDRRSRLPRFGFPTMRGAR